MAKIEELKVGMKVRVNSNYPEMEEITKHEFTIFEIHDISVPYPIRVKNKWNETKFFATNELDIISE